MHYLDRQGQKFSGIDEGHQKVPFCIFRENLYLIVPYLHVCEAYLLGDPHLFKICPKIDSNCPRTWNYTQNVPPGVKYFLSWWLVLVGMGFPKLIKIFSRFKYYAHMKFLSISPQLNFSRYSTANFKVIGPAWIFFMNLWKKKQRISRKVKVSKNSDYTSEYFSDLADK